MIVVQIQWPCNIVQIQGSCNVNLTSTGEGYIGKLLDCRIQYVVAEWSKKFSCNQAAWRCHFPCQLLKCICMQSVSEYDQEIPQSHTADRSTKFDQNIWCGSRLMRIFTKRPRPAKMMLGKASPPFCIPVTGQC